MKPIQYRVLFVNFLIAALLGLLLRGAFVFPIEGMTFLYVLHGHSHVALLGWLYLLVYLLLVNQFALQNPREERFYRRLFWVTQVAVLGMAVTFPFQGYAAPSIFFSTLHIICSYAFVYRLWRYHRITNKQQALWVKTALFFMVFSTLGVWFLGPAIGMMGKASAFFQLCIQFFLHFQFDGWFFTAFIALLLPQFFPKGMEKKSFQRFYTLLITSVVLTYALPASWYIAAPSLYYINGVGVLLQTLAFGYGIKPLYQQLKLEKRNQVNDHQANYNLALAVFAGICLVLRLITQFAVLNAAFAEELKGIRSWIVSFIHLNMLGLFTALGLLLLIQKRKLALTTWTKVGVCCLLLGFSSTEGILAIQGAQQFFRFTWLDAETSFMLLFGFSIFLLVSVVCFLVHGKDKP